MVICAVFKCNSNNDKRLKRNSNESASEKIKFYGFPKDSTYREIWRQKCCRKDTFNIKTSYICAKHFTADQFSRNLKHELLNYSPKNSRNLKLDAVPTENLPSSTTNKELSSLRQKRQKQRETKRLVTDILNPTTTISELTNNVMLSVVYGTVPHNLEKATSTSDLNEQSSEESDRNSKPVINDQIVENDRLMKECNRLKQECSFLKQENDYIKTIFTHGQRRKMQNIGKRIRWEVNDISQAIAIYASGPKAYRMLLKKKYPFPAVSTLRTWVGKININPGYLGVVFSLMQNADLTKYQKVCVLMADEMKIQNSYEYDQRTDTLLPPANYYHLYMIMESWNFRKLEATCLLRL